MTMIPWPGGFIEAPQAKMIFLDERETLTYVNEEDYEWLREKCWYPSSDGRHCRDSATGKRYAIRKERRGGRAAPVRTFYMHIEILKRHLGPPPVLYGSRGRRLKIIGDHINGNSLDNRYPENLRWATMSENNANKFGLAYRQLFFNIPAYQMED